MATSNLYDFLHSINAESKHFIGNTSTDSMTSIQAAEWYEKLKMQHEKLIRRLVGMEVFVEGEVADVSSSLLALRIEYFELWAFGESARISYVILKATNLSESRLRQINRGDRFSISGTILPPAFVEIETEGYYFRSKLDGDDWITFRAKHTDGQYSDHAIFLELKSLQLIPPPPLDLVDTDPETPESNLKKMAPYITPVCTLIGTGVGYGFGKSLFQERGDTPNELKWLFAIGAFVIGTIIGYLCGRLLAMLQRRWNW